MPSTSFEPKSSPQHCFPRGNTATLRWQIVAVAVLNLYITPLFMLRRLQPRDKGATLLLWNSTFCTLHVFPQRTSFRQEKPRRCQFWTRGLFGTGGSVLFGVERVHAFILKAETTLDKARCVKQSKSPVTNRECLRILAYDSDAMCPAPQLVGSWRLGKTKSSCRISMSQVNGKRKRDRAIAHRDQVLEFRLYFVPELTCDNTSVATIASG